MSDEVIKVTVNQQHQFYQPFYYHIDDISKILKERLAISVTLKKIIQENNKTLQYMQEVKNKNSNDNIEVSIQNNLKYDDNKSPSSSLDIKCDVAWQEKIYSPKEELFFFSDGKIMTRSHEGGKDDKNENYNKNKGNDSINSNNSAASLDIQNDMKIFTYTHEDIFFSEANTTSMHYTDDNRRSKNVLELKDRNKGIIPYRIMYIMAAVDCNGVRTNAHKYYDSNSSDMQPSLDYHEQILCQIKAYNNGVLEVTPGFSVEEPEEDDENCLTRTSFLHRNSKVKSTKQETTKKSQPLSKLTTFRFCSKSGNVFEYTMCNKNGISDINDIERICNEENYVDQCILSEKSQYYKLLSSYNLTSLGSNNNSNSNRPPLVAVSIEIISIENFDIQTNIIGEQSYVYINHDMSPLPKGWKQITSHEDDNDVNYTRKLNGCDGRNTTPLAILPSACLFQEFRVDEIHFIVALTIPMALVLIIFYESIVAKTVWIIPLVIALIGVGGSPYQRNRCSRNKKDACHFNYPINFYLQPPQQGTKSENDEDNERKFPTNICNNNSITMAFEVCSRKPSGFFTIEGYGFLNIPLLSVKEGSHMHTIKTWKNKGGRGRGGIFANIRKNMHEYYLGGTNKSSSALTTATTPPFEFNEVFQLYQNKTSKIGYISESYGDIVLRVNITRERTSSTKQGSSNSNNVSDFTNEIDTVLSRVRKNRTERKIREIANNNQSDTDVLSSLLTITSSNTYVPTISSTSSTINSLELTNNDMSHENTTININNGMRREISTITITPTTNPRTVEILSRIKHRKEARKNDSLLFDK